MPRLRPRVEGTRIRVVSDASAHDMPWLNVLMRVHPIEAVKSWQMAR